jgi:hypothetical protein
MGKVILAALVSGIVAALVTATVLSALRAGEGESATVRVAATEERLAEQKEDLASALRRIDSLTKAVEGGGGEGRSGRATAPADADQAPATPGAVAPDGTPYVSRAELEKALKEHLATTQAVPAPEPAVPKRSVEEIAGEMGLSATEEANVRQILRESEEEAIRCLFGERPLAEVRDEFRAAKEDPEKMSALAQDMVGRAFANLGKLMTLENRTKRRVEETLGKERAKEFLGKPRKPVTGVDVDEVLSDLDFE